MWLPEFPESERESPEKARTMIGLLLLHDVRIWVGHLHRPTVLDVLESFKKFDIIGAEFVPFFKENTLATPSSGDVRVSVYKTENEFLLVVMNMSDNKKEDEQVSLNLKRAGFAYDHNIIVVDHETDSSLEIKDDGVIEVDIPPKDFRLVRVTRQMERD
jgi:hypothetical protein